MIITNSITNAIVTTISSFQTAVDCNFKVERFSIFNTRPNLSPWVGIYKPEIIGSPGRNNITQPWKAIYDTRVIVQVAGTFRNPELPQVMLDDSTNIVLTAVNCNRSLYSTVENFIEWSVTPGGESLRDDTNQDYFYSNELHFKFEVFA